MIFEISEPTDPIALFKDWFAQAEAAGVTEPNAMALATASVDSTPQVRMVLLKKTSEKGFCFFTNYESLKGQNILSNPKASLCLHWRKPFHRQVRIMGTVNQSTAQESQEYFQSRAWGSQVAATISPQSRPISSRKELDSLFKEAEEKYKNQTLLSCPKNWGGFWVNPQQIEFWQEQDFRRHDRWRFSKNKDNLNWTVTRLAP